jgi:hypothetical protein
VVGTEERTDAIKKSKYTVYITDIKIGSTEFQVMDYYYRRYVFGTVKLLKRRSISEKFTRNYKFLTLAK